MSLLGAHSLCWFCQVAAQVKWLLDDNLGINFHILPEKTLQVLNRITLARVSLRAPIAVVRPYGELQKIIP